MLTYSKSGVDYTLLDPIKKMAQLAGLNTVKNIQDTWVKEVTASRGETAYILEAPDCYYALVEEGLGTKNLVADEMRKITGKTYYDAIAQDTVATIVNDIITVGARCLSVLAYWAAGDSNWWKDIKRTRDLVTGWKKACNLAKATWGGGETPSLGGVINQDTIDLAGAAFGIIKPKSRIILGDKLKSGDAIILLESNGIHANGLTLARRIANKIPNGYAIRLNCGKMYGEELLRPSYIYCRLVDDLFRQKIDIHYMINVTGHGWKKMMRARQPFTYKFFKIPPVDDFFTFIQKSAGISAKEMYGTFNMGAGFGVIVNSKDKDKVVKIAGRHNIKAYLAGTVEKGIKKVVIEPLNIVYTAKEFEVR